MNINRLFLLWVGLTLVGSVLACSPNAAQVNSSPKPVGVAARAPTQAREPVAVVNAYYSAVKMREMDAALMYLANDIVHVETKPAPCTFAVMKGQQSVENVLKDSKVLSFSVDNLQVDGNKVTYSVTKWLDPRIVGPEYPQPVRSRLVAIVEYGQIVSITETRDPELLAIRTRASQGVPCW